MSDVIQVPVLYKNRILAMYSKNTTSLIVPDAEVMTTQSKPARLTFEQKQRLIRIYDERIAAMTRTVRHLYYKYHQRAQHNYEPVVHEREYIPESILRERRAFAVKQREELTCTQNEGIDMLSK